MSPSSDRVNVVALLSLGGSVVLACALLALAAACLSPAHAAGIDLEVDFTAPPGHTVRHEAGMVALAPAAIERDPCVSRSTPTCAAAGRGC